MQQLVEKIGLLPLGAEIGTVTGIPVLDAITRGSQIRQEGLFSSVASHNDLVLISPDTDQSRFNLSLIKFSVLKARN